MKTKQYTFIIEKTHTGFSVYSNTLPVFSTGHSISELYMNAAEALNLYFEEEEKTVTANNIRFVMNS